MDIQSYKKKNGKTAYKFRFYIGKVQGKDKYIKRSGFESKAEARSAITQITIDLKTPKSNMKFMELYLEWLKGYKKDVKESTYLKTTKQFEKHVIPLIGSTKISDFTPLTLQENANTWSNDLKYGRKVLGMVKKILNHAVKMQYLQSNPAMYATAPKMKREIQVNKNFYDKEELKDFMSLVYNTNDIEKIALFRLLAFTGVRKGELLALKWSDINDSTLDINKAVSRNEKGLVVDTTKNKASERLVSLDKKTIDILNDLREQYPKRAMLFESESGGIMTPSKPRKWLIEITKGSSLNEITIHGFRHTHASLIFDSGMTLKQAQHRLGHSDLKTTMNIYTHITQRAIDDIGDKFSTYIDF